MMPITMMKDGETGVIKKVGGKEETRKFLENLGFVVGGSVTVVSDIGGNLIVNVKDFKSSNRQGYGMQNYGIALMPVQYTLAISIYIGGLL